MGKHFKTDTSPRVTLSTMSKGLGYRDAKVYLCPATPCGPKHLRHPAGNPMAVNPYVPPMEGW